MPTNVLSETDLNSFLISWAHEWLCGPHVSHQRAEHKRGLTKGTTVHSPWLFPLKFSALCNQQTSAQASGRTAQSYAFGTKLQCWSSAQLPFHWSAPLHSNLHLTLILTLTPRSPQKPKRDPWVTLMFILMHLSPHSWYKIRKSEAKTKRSGVLASEGHHIYIYSWWPIQVIARQSLETENSLDPAEPWKFMAARV